MKRFSLILLLFTTLASVNSCKNDLEAIAPYKESIAVYGMIDPTDSVNYIRVNRVFLGTGDATQVAQIQDSVYFKPGEASVIVEKYWNGTLRQKYIFSETYEKPLEPGAFNINQLIYKSRQKFKSDSAGKAFDYVLKVTSVKTSAEFESEKINLVKDVSSNPAQICGVLGANCFFSDPNSIVSISPYQIANTSAQTKVRFATPKFCVTSAVKLKFYYTEKYLNSTSTNKIFEFNLGEQDSENLAGGEALDFSFPGYSFFNSLNTSIVDNNNVFERVADSIRFFFILGAMS